jgi:hypothetical protein
MTDKLEGDWFNTAISQMRETDNRSFVEKDYDNIQHAVVAFSGCINEACILFATPALENELKEAAIGARDIWDSDKGAGEVLIWEGRIVSIVYPNTPNGPEEYDVDYQGIFRKPTDEEWECIRQGKTPFPREPDPDDKIEYTLTEKGMKETENLSK